MSFHCPDRYRWLRGAYASEPGDQFGAFFIPMRPGRTPLKVIATDGNGDATLDQWEHVSVSLPDRCPTWDEMAFVKTLFWDENDCVVQFHPPRSEYVNNHPYCLHLWRSVDRPFPMPPSILVGYKALGTFEKKALK